MDDVTLLNDRPQFCSIAMNRALSILAMRGGGLNLIAITFPALWKSFLPEICCDQQELYQYHQLLNQEQRYHQE
jgi:hypothetical protein